MGWFEKRLKSKSLGLARREVVAAFGTVKGLKEAVEAASRGDQSATESSINRLFSQEKEVDDLRRSLFAELAKGNLEYADREDIMSLMKRIDDLADNVKDAARSIRLLEGAEVPKAIWDSFTGMSIDLVECADTLRVSISELDSDLAKAEKAAEQVEVVESRLDEEYQKTRSLFIKYSRSIDPAILMILKDLSDFIEQAADTCADTADYVRVLAARGS
jgi:predicted phosphate transport protein (TIGR00153 family)